MRKGQIVLTNGDTNMRFNWSNIKDFRSYFPTPSEIQTVQTNFGFNKPQSFLRSDRPTARCGALSKQRVDQDKANTEHEEGREGPKPQRRISTSFNVSRRTTSVNASAASNHIYERA